MNSEINTQIDHSYIPPTWILTALQCVGEQPLPTAVPAGICVTVAEDIRNLALVRHNGPNTEYGGTDDGPIYWPAYYYLLSAGCPLAAVDRIMNSHSQLKTPEFTPIADIYGLSLPELRRVLETRLAPLYMLSNQSLDAEFEHGFNQHGLEHIRLIADRTVVLLQALGFDENVQKLGLIMAYGHDLGNVLSRKLHSLVSPYLLELCVPELHQDETSWCEIVRGIELHNEPIAKAYIKAEMVTGKTEDEVYASINPATKALIAADKTHIDPSRVSEKALAILEALNSDRHVETNYLLHTIFAGIQDPGVYVWRLEKERTMSAAENDQFTDLVKNKHAALSVEQTFLREHGKPTSNFTHIQHQEHHVLHIDTLEASMWALYLERIKLAIQCLLAMSGIKQVRIEIVDPELERSGQQVTRSFTRENKGEKLGNVQELARITNELRDTYDAAKKKEEERKERERQYV